MSDVTQLLDCAAEGDPDAAQLPLVYEELRAIAAAGMTAEPAGCTLQPTALVHEAFLPLVGSADVPRWNTRGHFFAAEAMRRILIDAARRRKRERHGGERQRVPLPGDVAAKGTFDEDLLAVHVVVDLLAEHDACAAELVKLHVFAGLTIEEATVLLGISARTGYRTWEYARAWMYRQLGGIPKS